MPDNMVARLGVKREQLAFGLRVEPQQIFICLPQRVNAGRVGRSDLPVFPPHVTAHRHIRADLPRDEFDERLDQGADMGNQNVSPARGDALRRLQQSGVLREDARRATACPRKSGAVRGERLSRRAVPADAEEDEIPEVGRGGFMQHPQIGYGRFDHPQDNVRVVVIAPCGVHRPAEPHFVGEKIRKHPE